MGSGDENDPWTTAYAAYLDSEARIWEEGDQAGRICHVEARQSAETNILRVMAQRMFGNSMPHGRQAPPCLYRTRPRLRRSRIRENSETGRQFDPKSHDFGYNEMSHFWPREVYVNNPPGITNLQQRSLVDAVTELDRLRNAEQHNPDVNSRIAAYEMAFRMKSSVPDLTDMSHEPQHILDAYAAVPGDGSFASNCLLARGWPAAVFNPVHHMATRMSWVITPQKIRSTSVICTPHCCTCWE